MQNKIQSIIVILALLAGSGCGGGLVVGGHRDVETVAVSDGSQQASTARMGAGASPSWLPLSIMPSAPQGTVAFTATASLITEDGHELPLVRDPRTAQLRLAARDTAFLGRSTVQDVRDVQARVTFTRVAADVTGGLLIAGLPVVGTVEVGILPGNPVVVEQAVALRGIGTRDVLIIDLNASQWLQAAVAGIVPASAFQSAVQLRTR